uniref:Uncharacterized protein n=1 Tax=Myoviridae sp. ctCo31 TaxID=2825053 RepID=A0A8S5UMP5_9CAUD|nr:MAG TPA: hypothetical protein [Myoviridae sp. ctCo31]
MDEYYYASYIGIVFWRWPTPWVTSRFIRFWNVYRSRNANRCCDGLDANSKLSKRPKSRVLGPIWNFSI